MYIADSVIFSCCSYDCWLTVWILFLCLFSKALSVLYIDYLNPIHCLIFMNPVWKFATLNSNNSHLLIILFRLWIRFFCFLLFCLGNLLQCWFAILDTHINLVIEIVQIKRTCTLHEREQNNVQLDLSKLQSIRVHVSQY